jgi:hypothetical protein
MKFKYKKTELDLDWEQLGGIEKVWGKYYQAYINLHAPPAPLPPQEAPVMENVYHYREAEIGHGQLQWDGIMGPIEILED